MTLGQVQRTNAACGIIDCTFAICFAQVRSGRWGVSLPFAARTATANAQIQIQMFVQGRTARWGIAWSFAVSPATANVPLARGAGGSSASVPVHSEPQRTAAAGKEGASAAKTQDAAVERQLALRRQRQEQEALQQQQQKQALAALRAGGGGATAPAGKAAAGAGGSATHASFEVQAGDLHAARRLLQSLRGLLQAEGASGVKVDEAAWRITAQLPSSSSAAPSGAAAARQSGTVVGSSDKRKERPDDANDSPTAAKRQRVDEAPGIWTGSAALALPSAASTALQVAPAGLNKAAAASALGGLSVRITMMQLQKGAYSVSASIPKVSSAADAARLRQLVSGLRLRLAA